MEYPKTLLLITIFALIIASSGLSRDYVNTSFLIDAFDEHRNINEEFYNDFINYINEENLLQEVEHMMGKMNMTNTITGLGGMPKVLEDTKRSLWLMNNKTIPDTDDLNTITVESKHIYSYVFSKLLESLIYFQEYEGGNLFQGLPEGASPNYQYIGLGDGKGKMINTFPFVLSYVESTLNPPAMVPNTLESLIPPEEYMQEIPLEDDLTKVEKIKENGGVYISGSFDEAMNIYVNVATIIRNNNMYLKKMGYVDTDFIQESTTLPLDPKYFNESWSVSTSSSFDKFRNTIVTFVAFYSKELNQMDLYSYSSLDDWETVLTGGHLLSVTSDMPGDGSAIYNLDTPLSTFEKASVEKVDIESVFDPSINQTVLSITSEVTLYGEKTEFGQSVLLKEKKIGTHEIYPMIDNRFIYTGDSTSVENGVLWDTSLTYSNLLNKTQLTLVTQEFNTLKFYSMTPVIDNTFTEEKKIEGFGGRMTDININTAFNSTLNETMMYLSFIEPDMSTGTPEATLKVTEGVLELFDIDVFLSKNIKINPMHKFSEASMTDGNISSFYLLTKPNEVSYSAEIPSYVEVISFDKSKDLIRIDKFSSKVRRSGYSFLFEDTKRESQYREVNEENHRNHIDLGPIFISAS